MDVMLNWKLKITKSKECTTASDFNRNIETDLRSTWEIINNEKIFPVIPMMKMISPIIPREMKYNKKQALYVSYASQSSGEETVDAESELLKVAMLQLTLLS